jgi:hypothetical protein
MAHEHRNASHRRANATSGFNGDSIMEASSTSPVTGIRFDMPTPQRSKGARYELRFAGLFNSGRGYAFPCDANGEVDIDNLGDRARSNYFYARTVIGREFFAPVTCPVGEK